MAIAGGLSGQFGMVDETTFGTPVTVSRFLEFNDESVKQSIERVESQGLRPNRRVLATTDWVPGRIGVDGDIDFEVQYQGFGLMLKHMLGSITSAQPNVGSAPTVWEHTGKVGQLDGKSFTCQLGAADTGGTARAFTYAGCKIPKWELSCEVDGLVMLKPSISAISESTAVALATANYASGIGTTPLAWTGAVLTVGGVATDMKKITLTGDSGLADDRYFMRGATNSATRKEQLEGKGIRNYGGTFDIEFSDLVAYNRFVNGTVGSLTAFFNGPVIAAGLAYGLEVTCPAVRFDGETPDISGMDLIDLTLPFKCLDDGSGTTAMQMVYRTIDTTP